MGHGHHTGFVRRGGNDADELLEAIPKQRVAAVFVVFSFADGVYGCGELGKRRLGRTPDAIICVHPVLGVFDSCIKRKHK
jgi:hypothetical protein